MPYYFLKPSGAPSELEKSQIEELRHRLDDCMRVWWKESKGEATRWRGLGCGDRDVCPVCGSYRQDVLAREAYEAMDLAMTGLKVQWGVELKSRGIKLVLTVPKSESERIDDLLFAGDVAA